MAVRLGHDLISGRRNEQKMLWILKTFETLCVVGQRGKADTTHSRIRAKQGIFNQLAWKGWAFIPTGSARGVSRS